MGTGLRSNIYTASCQLGDRGMSWSSLSPSVLICTTDILCPCGRLAEGDGFLLARLDAEVGAKCGMI